MADINDITRRIQEFRLGVGSGAMMAFGGTMSGQRFPLGFAVDTGLSAPSGHNRRFRFLMERPEGMEGRVIVEAMTENGRIRPLQPVNRGASFLEFEDGQYNRHTDFSTFQQQGPITSIRIRGTRRDGSPMEFVYHFDPTRGPRGEPSEMDVINGVMGITPRVPLVPFRRPRAELDSTEETIRVGAITPQGLQGGPPMST